MRAVIDQCRASVLRAPCLLADVGRPAARGRTIRAPMAACFVRAILAALGSAPMLGCSSMRPWSWPSIRENPSHLLAGTDLGLLGSRNGGRTWTSGSARSHFRRRVRRDISRRRRARDLRRAERRIPFRRWPMGAGATPRKPRCRPGAIAAGASADRDLSARPKSPIRRAGTAGRPLSPVRRTVAETSEMTALAVARSERRRSSLRSSTAKS